MNPTTVTRLRPAAHDAHDNPVDEDPDELELTDCIVAPRSTADIATRGRQGVVVGLTLYVPDVDADIVHTDQVQIGDDVWEVDGEVGRWENPFDGNRPGLEVALKRGEG